MNEIEQAIKAARRSEVVIVVVGGSSARDFKTSYKETGAAVAEEGSVSDMEKDLTVPVYPYLVDNKNYWNLCKRQVSL